MQDGYNQTNQNMLFSHIETGLTQNFNFHWRAAIELRHTLNLCEGDVVSALKAMASLIQTCHNRLIVLEKPRMNNIVQIMLNVKLFLIVKRSK